MSFADFVSISVQRHPHLLRLMTGLARRIAPVFVFGRSAVVLGAEEVRDVLARAGDFELGPIGGPKMLMGPFLLGMDLRQQYHDDRKHLGEILEGLDPSLKRIARQRAEQAAKALAVPPAGADVDIVRAFAEPVVTRIASEFYGVKVPSPGQTSVLKVRDGEELLAAWLRKVGSVIATSSPAPFGLQGVAEKCASEFEEHLRAVIRERRSSGAPSQDVLQGLLAIQDDERARANVAGLMLAGSTALVKSLTQALQQLVRRPEKLRDAIVAAKEACDREDQNRSAAGWKKLRALLLEALRFSPAFPMLVRYCTRDSVIGSGANARKVPAGSNVYVVMLAAMFDDSVEEADGFSAARPRDTYLHFGAGPHECLGKRIAVIEMVEMLRAFLALLDPAKVEQMTAGEIEYDGPAAHRLILHVRGAVR